LDTGGTTQTLDIRRAEADTAFSLTSASLTLIRQVLPMGKRVCGPFFSGIQVLGLERGVNDNAIGVCDQRYWVGLSQQVSAIEQFIAAHEALRHKGEK